jgi:hypothetical protein
VSALLERYERQALLLDNPRKPREYEPITEISTEGWEDVMKLASHEGRRWKEIGNRLHASGEPQALLGGLVGIVGEVPTADLAAVTGGAANVEWWKALLYTPVPALTQSKAMFSLDAEGTVTSSGAGQTLTPSEHISSTGAVGTNLTACPTAQALGSTITNAIWRFEADITIRVAGVGTTAVAIGAFSFAYTVLANGGAPTTIIWRSTANATFDSTITNGACFGATPSAAGVSVTPRQIRWGSWN